MPDPRPAELICPSCRERYPAGGSFCPQDGSRLVASAGESSLVGQVLANRYRIVRKIGEGGMGEVFEAQHVYIDKRYAIKTLRPDITTNPEAITRFHQEARSASTIGHENIVEIDDFGRLPDGGVYLAMEFLDGESLAERMKHGPALQRREKLDILIQVCSGLAAAHDKGIVHRDMKPENVFLAKKGERVVVKVLDFGIAKVTSDNAHERLTQTGTIFGTPFYMSPEQALGKDLDGRTDIYSVGVILYEVFAGKVPFEGESFMGILSQHITARPTPPSEAAPYRDVPPGVERAILRALAKEPAERWQSMHELAAELERLRDEAGGEPGSTRARTAARPARTAARPADVVLEPELAPYEPIAMQPATLAAAREHEPQPEADLAPVELEEPRRPSQPLPVPAAAHATHRLVVILVVGLLLVGGASLLAVLADLPRHRPRETRRATTAASLAPGAQSSLPTSEVVIDSVPTGAKVFADGRVIAETPDAIKVPSGRTLEVLIRKDGFVPKQIVLDPSRDPKLVVRLERERHGGAPLHHGAHPSPHAPE